MKAKRKKNETCIIVGCGRPRVRRGLCEPCYYAACRAIRRGDETWNSLVEAGLATDENARITPITRAMKKMK